MEIYNWTSKSEDETIELGKKFAQFLNLKDIVVFQGDLGAGKTEFIKGICDFFSVEDIVTSPTFAIINQYHASKEENDFLIYHIDLYRIKNENELEEIGFTECLNDNDSIKLIEWPQNAGNMIYHFNYLIKIDIDDKNEDLRYITVSKN